MVRSPEFALRMRTSLFISVGSPCDDSRRRNCGIGSWPTTTADLWAAAAENIVREQPACQPDWNAVALPTLQPLPGSPRPKQNLAGEAPRGKTHPSVSDLMARRVKNLNEMHDKWLGARTKLSDQLEKLIERSENSKRDELRDKLTKQIDEMDQHEPDASAGPGSDMALYLAQWDAKAALPLLKEMMARCRREIAQNAEGSKLYEWYAAHAGPRFGRRRAITGRIRGVDSRRFAERYYRLR